MKENMEYKSSDFYLCACILSSGYELVRLERKEKSTYNFVFSISPDQANKLIADHWSRRLIVPSRDLIDAIYELKTRIHHGK